MGSQPKRFSIAQTGDFDFFGLFCNISQQLPEIVHRFEIVKSLSHKTGVFGGDRTEPPDPILIAEADRGT